MATKKRIKRGLSRCRVRYYDVSVDGGKEVFLPRFIEDVAEYLDVPPDDIEEVPIVLSPRAPPERSYVAVMGCTARTPPLDVTMVTHHRGEEEWFIPFAYGHFVVCRYDDRKDRDYCGLDDTDIAMLKRRTIRGTDGKFVLLTEVAEE